MKSLKTICIDTALGPITLAASQRGLCGLWFEHQKHGPSDADRQNWQPDENHPLLQHAASQIRAYLDKAPVVFDLALDLSAGTPFQQSVWQALLTIPAGQTCSYGELARHLGNAQAVRAVGAATGRNPVSIIVPCHRILGASGQLTGYAGGLWRKQALLAIESQSGF